MTTLRNVTPGELGEHRAAFGGKVNDCLNNPQFKGYLSRNLVQRDDVMDALVDGVAFRQALQRTSYKRFSSTYVELQELIRQTAVITARRVSSEVITVGIAGTILIVALVPTIISDGLLPFLIAVVSTMAACSSVLLFSAARSSRKRGLSRLVFSLAIMLVSVCAVILPHVFLGVSWTSFVLYITWLTVLLICYLLINHQTATDCKQFFHAGYNKIEIAVLKRDVIEVENEWLEDCVEDIITPQVVLTINTILGKDKDRLLVEQDSEGLRKLQDPRFTVSTLSERRIASVLAQMDGGSIALAGPRGAGKSTLLRKFAGPQRTELKRSPCISVYLAAPAEYSPRDFITELFRELCEAYLSYTGSALPEPIYKESTKVDPQSIFRRALSLLWLAIRTAAAAAIIVWAIRSFVTIHYHHLYVVVLANLKGYYHHVPHNIYTYLRKYFKPQWAIIRAAALIAVSLFALRLFPGLATWKRFIRRRAEPALSRKARDYLYRLQVEKTVTWGASVNYPAPRGIGIGLSRGGTAAYIPWTFPELVRHTRSFMQEISTKFQQSSHAVVVGIDEIDRIGSLDHAAKFVGEIKAIFGLEKCFFLVAVAEDVGSVFAQRATAGRSILENAFDDIVMVASLDVQETRDLLLKRVPGFTDSFVYLVHALSGGLPRELIRVTRRLVDLNQELRSEDRHPRLQDLAFMLVKEELIESMRATRSQMSRLTLHRGWAIFFEKLGSVGAILQYADFTSIGESRRIINELSVFELPGEPGNVGSKQTLSTRDEDRARRIAEDFLAFADFGVTVIDAFSDKFFDLHLVQQRSALGSEGSYEVLAVARAELNVSTENSRAMLSRFRDSLNPV